jgi:hypothetical protein
MQRLGTRRILRPWGFAKASGDEILAVTSDSCRMAFEKLSWQCVLIFVASHRHWKNALAVPGSAEDWAEWSDERRREWLNKVKQKPTTLPTAEGKRQRKKTAQQRDRSRGRSKERTPQVVVVESRRSRGRSRSRSRERSRGRSKEQRRSREGEWHRSRDGERHRSRSRSRTRGKYHSPEYRGGGGYYRSRSDDQRTGGRGEGSREKQRRETRGRSGTRGRRKPKCLDCGGEHYADDEAFHPDHPKAVSYDSKGSPGRR